MENSSLAFYFDRVAEERGKLQDKQLFLLSHARGKNLFLFPFKRENCAHFLWSAFTLLEDFDSPVVNPV